MRTPPPATMPPPELNRLAPARTVPAARPRRRRGRRLATLVLVVAVLALLADRGYAYGRDQMAPVTARSEPVAFQVSRGESSVQVAEALQRADLIRSALLMEVYLRYLAYRGRPATIEAGVFRLNRDMSLARIVAALAHAGQPQVKVTLPDGDTMAEMAALAQKAGVGTAQQYLAAAQDETAWVARFPYLGSGRPPGAPGDLEGFLYPDSYDLNKGATVQDLIADQLQRFQQVVGPLEAQMAQPTASRPPESLYAIVTLASIVQREVTSDQDRAMVCGIFYNRLSQGMPLQDDMTVAYGLGISPTQLTTADLQKDTPYNTYLHKGLPVGPISNPSLASIKACVQPTPSPDLFFFTDPKGVAHYARTYAQFQQQEQQYGVGAG